jgi:RNA polymerase sigma factor (sigma-70 family)
LYTPIHTEQQLLAAFATGERYAATKIYSQHYSIVNGWMRKTGAADDDVADVFQEAMMILYEKVQQEEFRLTCAVGTYLFAISKNLWYKKISSKHKMPGQLPDDAGGEGDDWAYEDDVNVQVEREAHYELLDTALAQLGEPCSSLIKAFYHQDKSMQEIAADFGYTNPDNAKTQKYKCLTRLRKIFYSMQG